MCRDCFSGKSFRDEEKKELRAARKRAWAAMPAERRLAIRAKMSAARKRAWADPALRAKVSAAMKLHWQLRKKAMPLNRLSEAN
jgi:hypothetical protein